MTIKQTLFLGFFILIGIFILNFFIDQKLSREVVTNSTYLSHSEEVIRNSNLLHKNIIDMQNGFRGYLLTGEDVFLEPYHEGLRTIPLLFNEQLALISYDQQKVRLDSINKLHAVWIKYSDALIRTKKDTLPEAGREYDELFERNMKMAEGKRINDQIKSIFTEFDKFEYGLRQKRRDALRVSITRTKNYSVTLTLFSVSIALICCLYIVRIIMRRIQKMATFASEISQGNFRQISDRRSDEFKMLTRSLNEMSGKLERSIMELTGKNKELDQFAYVVSHDLKAPLRGIANITTWIEEDHEKELSPEVADKINLIKGRIKRLESMIEGLLAYARVGKAKNTKENVNVEELLKEVVEMIVPKSFQVVTAKNMPVLFTDQILLEQVFSNILSNAVKHNDKDLGTIEINCKDLGEKYEFSIADNGPGIPQEYHSKVFVIFQTLKERDAFESTGVGLAIVKKIIEEQRGIILLKRNDPVGTIFTFTWPKY